MASVLENEILATRNVDKYHPLAVEIQYTGLNITESGRISVRGHFALKSLQV